MEKILFPFLKWLKPSKPTYNWLEVSERIFKLTKKIKSIINEGDRCLILSENRPYWLISDIAIMNAGGISVPIFTTYSPDDYKYILNDCKPTIVIVSNNDQFKKIEKFLNPEIKKIISFEKIKFNSLLINEIVNDNRIDRGISKDLVADTLRSASFAMPSAPPASALIKSANFESSDLGSSNIGVNENGLISRVSDIEELDWIFN